MNDEEVIRHLTDLPVERFVDLLRRVFELKQPFPEEAAYCHSRFYLGTAHSDLESDEGEPERWRPWKLDAVAYLDPDTYGHSDDLGPYCGLCQAGTCMSCETPVRSNVKHGLCPICGSPVNMT